MSWKAKKKLLRLLNIKSQGLNIAEIQKSIFCGNSNQRTAGREKRICLKMHLIEQTSWNLLPQSGKIPLNVNKTGRWKVRKRVVAILKRKKWIKEN